MNNQAELLTVNKNKELEVYWFRYKDKWEKILLERVITQVTGSKIYLVFQGKSANTKKCGCVCTKSEAKKIKMLFSSYKDKLNEELKKFMINFINQNKILPDESARCYSAWKNISEEEAIKKTKEYFELIAPSKRNKEI